ncbi:MAG: hypothetical protein HS109_08870 [Burkholderiales bacterium]|nr:hypothetical protein [Burkholderiales bacterium]MCC6377367.1 hypothetical protein [Burkholderiales bacterium]MCE7877866.1 hypothetical protein [Betaproteobacteria bacterium PRO3]
MKHLNSGLMAACALGVALFGGEPGTALAQKLRDTGLCHLANVNAQKVIYNGQCKITQESTQYGFVITVRMGNAEPWKVACQRDGSSCMHGPTEVRMRDRGNGEASFRWQEGGQAFRLDVEAD